MSFLRRLAFAPIVLLAVGAVTYGVPRVLRPDRYPVEQFFPGLARDLDRVFLHPHDIVRRHAAPMSYPGTFSFIAVSAPLVITNMVLVERTLSVPGFFKYTWRAAGHENLSVAARDPVPDFALLCALGLWGAVLLIVLGLIADAIVARFDPRVRASSDRAW